jgi:hypothetical protein
MNAPPPPNTPPQRQRATVATSCVNTRLAVPECSCLDCLEHLIRAHAPALLAPHVYPPAS